MAVTSIFAASRHAPRLIAVGILSLVLAVPVFGLLLPAMDALEARRARVATLEGQVARLRALAGAREGLLKQSTDLAARRGNSGLLLNAGSEAAAAASLQNIVKTAVARAGGDLRSTQSLPAADDSGVRRMTVRAHLSTEIEGLRVFLHAIESGAPLLFVDDLDIRARSGAQRDEEGAVLLDVRIDLAGYLGGK